MSYLKKKKDNKGEHIEVRWSCGEAWWLRRLVFQDDKHFSSTQPSPNFYFLPPLRKILDWADSKASTWLQFERGFKGGVLTKCKQREEWLDQKNSVLHWGTTEMMPCTKFMQKY